MTSNCKWELDQRFTKRLTKLFFTINSFIVWAENSWEYLCINNIHSVKPHIYRGWDFWKIIKGGGGGHKDFPVKMGAADNRRG